jgi:hypothetical protein
MDEVREIMRLHHYSIHTERTCCKWIKKYVCFHKMRSRDDLQNSGTKIKTFLTDLAVNKDIAPVTQNQTKNSLK